MSARFSAATVLEEIDRLAAELRMLFGRRPSTVASVDAPANPPSPTPRTVPPAGWGLPVLYLETRIAEASRLAAAVRQEMARAGPASGAVGEHLEQLNRELERAVREIEFLGSSADFGFEPRAAPAESGQAWDESSPRPPTGARPMGSGRGAVAAPPTGPRSPFHGFTAERYDQTVGALHARRSGLLVWTVVIAVGISVALEVANLLGHEPMPAWWIAVLPIVWLVPVPFFVLSFRGAQRMLRDNELERSVKV